MTARAVSAHRRIAALALVAPLLLGGCALGGTRSAAATEPAGTEPAATELQLAAAATPSIRITPTDGSPALPPGQGVTVSVDSGTLSHVDLLASNGRYLPGEFNSDHTGWTSTAKLAPSQSYSVDATAANSAGEPGESKSTFTTAPAAEADRLLITSVSPAAGSRIGVAHPLVVTFNRPVHDRQAVSDALHVETSPHVEGAWYWIDPQTVDYRPPSFWTPGTVVTLHAALTGVQGGENLWGTQNTDSSFTVDRAQIIRVDLAAGRMTVERDGQQIAEYPVSGGKPGWQTRNGIMTIMGKVTDKTWTNTAIDAPEEYILHSKYAMRITASGEFIHDAPWNRGNITAGLNTSHGCIGMLTSDMAKLFAQTAVGDAVIVTGSPRPFGPLSNRIADWNIPWSSWVGGNLNLTYR
jgi:lipoprotein-anchoring transpeptidase ErfK/SrfK